MFLSFRNICRDGKPYLTCRFYFVTQPEENRCKYWFCGLSPNNDGSEITNIVTARQKAGWLEGTQVMRYIKYPILRT